MLEFDPHNQQELAFALKKTVRLSGLKLNNITERLHERYGAQIIASGLPTCASNSLN
jgi:uncharacterized protein (DUF2132 family)